jgi:hypothetical protein
MWEYLHAAWPIMSREDVGSQDNDDTSGESGL